jgi:hypothetical protein
MLPPPLAVLEGVIQGKRSRCSRRQYTRLKTGGTLRHPGVALVIMWGRTEAGGNVENPENARNSPTFTCRDVRISR